ncbi:hypothetical protein BpHYR1_027633 [Brachionus plicatilis]|uniref:Uncharacterized protein n=1 Tax=Brachionus plicatilis TaxID=10195 RepID=A0A3M7PVZ4_BRAPC|nr:hypothetical protein BpHYR1_027633 [Brachionus plicatilis]
MRGEGLTAQLNYHKSVSEVKLLKDRIVLGEQKIHVLNKEIDRFKTKVAEFEPENEILKRQLYNFKFDTVVRIQLKGNLSWRGLRPLRTSPALLVYRLAQRIQKDKGIILSFEFYFSIRVVFISELIPVYKADK